MNRTRRPLTVIATLVLVAAMVHVFVFVQRWPHRAALASQIATQASQLAASQRAAESLTEAAQDADGLQADVQHAGTTLPGEADLAITASALSRLADVHDLKLSDLHVTSGELVGFWANRAITLQLCGTSSDIAAALAAIESLPVHPHVRRCQLATDGSGSAVAGVTLMVLCNPSEGVTP